MSKLLRVALYAPEGYWIMAEKDPEELARIAGGCGPGGLGDWLVPDRLLGLSIRPACHIHDFQYHFGHTYDDPEDENNKKRADRIFKNNMMRIIMAGTRSGILFWIRRRLARRYYQAVRDFGDTAFWSGKNRPECEHKVNI